MVRNLNRRKDNVANVLLVDSDPATARAVLEVLARKGIRGHLARDEETAMDFIDKTSCDLVLLSESIPKHLNGGQSSQDSQKQSMSATSHVAFRLLENIRTSVPELPVIMLGNGHDRDGLGDDTNKKPEVHRQAVATVVRAIRCGCCDFLVKPVERQALEAILDTFLPCHIVSTLAADEQDTRCLYRIVGSSAKLQQTVSIAKRIAPTLAPVLISGESGTGKELISYLVHHESKRAEGPYVKVNCAALSDSLVESELFGHEKGSFTGAYSQRKGRLEMAHGGTLLLDEISETPPRFQAKLLRVIEQQDFERVGGNENVRVDVRIISTTNRNLLRQVERGCFRRDLYYRLSGIRLFIAPLRQRKDDLPDLVWHFVNLYAREGRHRIMRLDPLTMEIFERYDWPGNVRQLRNVVRTALILGSGETFALGDVSWLLDEGGPGNSFSDFQADALGSVPSGGDAETDEGLDGRLGAAGRDFGLAGLPLEVVERRAILDTLRQTAGNQTRAAKVLGISDRTLRDKIKRYREQGCVQVSR
jgi:DNA-binding NtrC family response regulator